MACPSETRLQAFVDGELPAAEIDALSTHLDTCDDCRTLVGVVQPVPLDDDTTVDTIGRYVLRRELGRGGMGVVYEAVDPELQRVVALKVLRSDLGREQTRLLKEAQAMAMLAHPNVVTIHDVGRTPAPQDRVFIVMALIEGVSLRHWLAREPRTLDAVLDAFAQAGDGLRAAHEAGLVHRDFKPENVFVANDGRVLVGDFGLAMTSETDAAIAEGSLAYMAPEQKNGEKVDARSDQYSFCLALDEAARTTGAVPSWLSRVVERGTQTRSDDRFDSMKTLLDAIASGRKSSRRRGVVFAVVALAVLVVSGMAWARTREPPFVAECRAHEGDMATVWNGERAQKTRTSFDATKSPLSEAAWTRASTTLDAYADGWRSAQHRTCESGRDPSARAAFEERKSCLAERVEVARAVTANLEHVDAPMLEQVPAMLALLPRIDACDDAREIAQRPSPPSPDKVAAVENARKKVATAAATIAAGRYTEGLSLADDAWRTANDTHYLPVLAEAYLWVGTAHGRLGHARDSEQALDQAVSSASAGRAQATAIRAWIQLMHFVGFEGKRWDDGVRWGDYAKTALESMPGAYELEAERLSWSRAMLLDRKHFDEALVVSREELALVELRFGREHRLTAAALDGLAGVLAGQCKARDAIEPQERACAILEKEFGTPHPQLALCLGNLAALRANLGEHERAIDDKKRALAMFERVPGHPNHVAMAHRNMVRSLLELGRFPEARAELETAAAASQRESDETSVLLLRAELDRRESHLDAARADLLAVEAKTKAADPSRRLDPLLALAEIDIAEARWNDAITHASDAAAIARKLHGEESCRIAAPLRAHAEALVGAGRAADALPLAEQSLRVLSTAQIDPQAQARSELALALALPPSARPRARALATSARASSRDPLLTKRIDDWLAR